DARGELRLLPQPGNLLGAHADQAEPVATAPELIEHLDRAGPRNERLAGEVDAHADQALNAVLLHAQLLAHVANGRLERAGGAVVGRARATPRQTTRGRRLDGWPSADRSHRRPRPARAPACPTGRRRSRDPSLLAQLLQLRPGARVQHLLLGQPRPPRLSD